MITLTRPEIEALLDHGKAAEAIEDAYRAVSLGKVNLPPVGYIAFPEHDGDCHIKYGHIESDTVFIIKIAAGFPHNTALDLPNGNGVTIVMSAESGAVCAVLHDEMLMTDVRISIGGAVATLALCRADSYRITILGTGVQARHQIEAHTHLMDGNLNFQIWGRCADKAVQVQHKLAADGIAISVAENLEQACRTADVIVTTTAARTPIVASHWIQPGTHITAAGERYLACAMKMAV